MNAFVLIWDWDCLDWGTKKSYFCTVSLPLCFCFLNGMWIQQATFLFVWTASAQPKVKTPKHPTHRYCKHLVCPATQQISALVMILQWTKGQGKGQERQRYNEHWDTHKGKAPNGSTPTCPPPPFSFSLLHTFEASLSVAHLRKTSVPPHDVEPCVSFCL